MLAIGRKVCRWILGAGLAIGFFAPVTAQETDSDSAKDAILILDASGSMWGQIDGVNKIVIAKDVVEELVRNLPMTQRLGFVAYGHRRKGDCADIETLADVGAERESVIEQVRALSPKGKTPLTKSIEHAAEQLNYKKQAASVILVSDGLENCQADPCALARTLEENGLDFTVHVVGFDVTEEERKGLQCIADETGGSFLAADNAQELNEALTQVAVAEPAEPEPVVSEPLPAEVVLKATILTNGPQINSDLVWSIAPAAGGDAIYTSDDTATVKTELLPGDYSVTAVWSGWQDGTDKTGMLDFTVTPQRVHVFTVPIDLALPVTLEAPDSIPEGVAMDITWVGPDSLGATVSVNRLDDDPLTKIYFFAGTKARGALDEAQPATAALAAPTQAGDYEIRYVIPKPPMVLERLPLTVTENPYTVTAVPQAPVSTEIEVAWGGQATPGDMITIVPKNDERAFDNGRYTPVKQDAPVKLTTPASPGEYEIRYVMYGGYTTYAGMQHAVQTSVPLVVTDVGATLQAAAEAVGGSTIEVTWTGPAEDWENDVISVVQAGAEKYNPKSRVAVGARGQLPNKASIRVPDIEGAYEIVYGLEPGRRLIARTPITIKRATATVDAPNSVKAGEDFTASVSGNAFKGDRAVVVLADRPDDKMWNVGVNNGFIASVEGGVGTVRGRVIAEPGNYEIRYVTGLEHQVLARDAFTVVE